MHLRYVSWRLQQELRAAIAAAVVLTATAAVASDSARAQTQAARTPAARTQAARTPVAPTPAAQAQVPAALQRHCAECHSGWDAEGDFDLDKLFRGTSGGEGMAAEQQLLPKLELAARRVRGRTMPPPADVEPLADDERRELLMALSKHAPRVPQARVATVRRLTRHHYERSVQDLFGVEWRAQGMLPDDASAHGFEGIGDVQNVSPLMFEKYLGAARSVAVAVLADDAASQTLFVEGAPLADVLPKLLARAYRRPPLQVEIADLASDYAILQRRGLDVEAVRRALLQSVLASPSFLYRAEHGRSTKPWQLTAHELAVRLSFLIASGPPDAALRAAAEDGSLLASETLADHALRLARSRNGFGLAEDFATQWLGLRDVLRTTADFRRFPAIWNKRLRPALSEELVHAFAFVVREDRSVLELIDADYAFVDRVLAKHYGLPRPKKRGFQRVALSDRRRGGVLGAGAMLMATSMPLRTSPVKRGQWILSKLLDAPPPPPPEDSGVLPRDDKNKKGLTLKQQMERHRRQPSCASCHAEMDALGFALENYDPLGRWRDSVHEQPVDTAAELADGTQLDGPLALKNELLRRADDFVRAFAKNLLVQGIGRDLQLADEPELLTIVAACRDGGYRFSALLTAVVASPLFRLRDPDHE
ncbi:MAG: DUF1588 domain-containing protein [Planctomycetota bacterium]